MALETAIAPEALIAAFTDDKSLLGEDSGAAPKLSFKQVVDLEIVKPGTLADYLSHKECVDKVRCQARKYQLDSAIRDMLVGVSDDPKIEMTFAQVGRRVLASGAGEQRIKVSFNVVVANNTASIFGNNFNDQFSSSYNKVLYPRATCPSHALFRTNSMS